VETGKHIFKIHGEWLITGYQNAMSVGRSVDSLYRFSRTSLFEKFNTFCISDIIVHLEYDGDDVKLRRLITNTSLSVTVAKDGHL
jgi:hypothetical protein